MMSAHDGVEVCLLGTVRALRDGTELPVGGALRAGILVMLAMNAGHPVSRERLMAALWGEDPPASATGNLYTYVSGLRSAFKPDRGLLTSRGGAYCLDLPEDRVDVFRFEAMREESRRHRAAGDPRAELETLAAAMRLWRGEPLAGVPGPYAESQRLRLTELRLAAAERRAALLIELGRNDEAAALLTEFVAIYRLQEALHGMLMAALHAAGRTTEALAVYDRLSRTLLEETGTDPSAALQEARRQIARSASARTVPTAWVAPVRLFGRDDQLAALRQAVTELATGRGRGIRIVGGAGSGKSALLAAALRDAGQRTGWGVGDLRASRTPLGLLRECLTSAGLLSASDPLPLSPSVVDAVARAATETPLILVADDFQWADAQTAAAWAALHEVTRAAPLLLVAATRGGTAMPADETLVLRPLDRTQAKALVDAVAVGRLDSRTVRRVLREAGGSPHFLRLLAEGRPDDTELTAAVEALLSVFGLEARHLMRAAAFLGGEPSVTELACVTGHEPAEIARLARPLRDSGLLTDDPGFFTFCHPVVSRVLHDGTPSALRIMLHRSFAQKIADSGGQPERVVAQLLAGPVPLDSDLGGWLARHVEQVAARAPQASVSLLRRVRAEYALDESTRLSLTVWLARLLYSQGRSAVADAGWVAARTTDVELEAEMRWITASSFEQLGAYEAAADVARAALSSRAFPAPWLQSFRSLIDRIRSQLPGEPTARSAVDRPVRDGPVSPADRRRVIVREPVRR